MKKLYTVSIVFLAFFTGSMLSAAHAAPVRSFNTAPAVPGQNHFQNMPNEILFNIFSFIRLKDIPNLYPVNKQFKDALSDNEHVKHVVSESSGTIRKQLRNRLTYLPIPLFCSWHSQQKAGPQKTITDELLTIVKDPTKKIWFTKKALATSAKHEKLTPKEVLFPIAAKPLGNLMEKHYLNKFQLIPETSNDFELLFETSSDVDELVRLKKLGLSDGDLTILNGLILSDRLSKSIPSNNPLKTIALLELGARPQSHDYVTFCDSYKKHEIKMKIVLNALKLNCCLAEDMDASHNTLDLYQKNQLYALVAQAFLKQDNLSKDNKKNLQLTLKSIKKLSEKSKNIPKLLGF